MRLRSLAWSLVLLILAAGCSATPGTRTAPGASAAPVANGTPALPAKPAPKFVDPGQKSMAGPVKGITPSRGGLAPDLSFTREPGTVPRRATATVAVKTAAGSLCSAVMVYQGKPLQAAGLGTKVADRAGAAIWSWGIPRDLASGTWPVVVTCGGQSATTAVTVPL